MPDIATLLPGQMVLVKAKVITVTDGRAWIEVSTGYTAAIDQADLVKALDEQAEPDRPLEHGDRVRDIQGVEWTVYCPPIAVEGQKPQVGLWNSEKGGVWDFPDNLVRVTEPTPSSAA